MTPVDVPPQQLPRYVSLPGAVGLGTVLLLVLLGWAAATSVEIVVTAPAEARPAGGVAELRAPETGTIARALAREGQRIHAGAVVWILETPGLEARRRALTEARKERQRELADSRTVLRWVELGAEPESAPTVLSRLRLREQHSRLAQLDYEIQALVSELEAARDQVRGSRLLLAVRDEQYAAVLAAHGQGALSRFELLQARQGLLAQRADVDGAVGRAAVVERRLSGRRSARDGAEAGFRQSLMRSVAALEVEVAELDAELDELGARRRLARIRAPVDGVLDRRLASVGDFVQRGESLGTIVPETAAVVFETRIAPPQVAFIHAGQACRIKLDALPFARYGAVTCTVELLGRDVIPAEGGPGYYPARVRPGAQVLEADGQRLRLQPGATAWVDIVAGERSVLSFVTDPLWRFAQESLRER